MICDLDNLEAERMKMVFRQRRASLNPLDISGVWRYREFLPFAGQDLDYVVTMGEGNSPLLDAPKSASYAGLKNLKIKGSWVSFNPSW